jgi:carboxypeptidase T
MSRWWSSRSATSTPGPSRLRFRWAVPAAIALAALAVPAASASPDLARPATPAKSYLLRVTASTPAQVGRLVNGGYDLVEAREGRDYFIIGDRATLGRLRHDGLAVRVDRTLPNATPGTPARRSTPNAKTPGVYPTFFGGYRTVAAHEQHVVDVATAHPDLAKVVDYGDSWRKQQGLGGHDLNAVCITKMAAGDCALSPSPTKPRLFVMASIHARELSPAEMAWRWIDYLVDNYNVLPDVTTLLDNQEVWVVPVVNPDGRDIVESGGSSPYLQRKNADATAGGACASPPTASNQAGVDLNRNATFKWGGVGSSTAPCDQTYRGTGGASEPEQAGLETLFSQLYADNRGPNDTDAAPSTTRGAMLTLHSYSNLTLLPWGWTTALAPNDAGFRSLAFRMSYYNGYKTGTGPETLYSTTGTTDDHIYGQLGVPGFTIEIGPTSGSCSGFTPAYSCQDGTFWPLIRGSLLSLAKNSRAPYVEAAGPATTSAAATVSGSTVTVTGTTNDNAYGNATGSVGRPATQNIAAGEYFLDTPPWAGGTAAAMTATDGAYNAKSEGIQATLSTVGLASGRHSVYVRGRDTAGVSGPVTTAWFTVP